MMCLQLSNIKSCLFVFSLKREKKKFETKKNFFYFFFIFCREIVLQPSKDLLRKISFLDCFEKCFVLLHTVCFTNLGKLIWWFDLKLEQWPLKTTLAIKVVKIYQKKNHLATLTKFQQSFGTYLSINLSKLYPIKPF